MKKSFTMRCMLIALFTVMSIAANAEVIEYSTDDGFKYNLDTEAKTAQLAKFSGSQKEVVIPENVTYNDVTYSVTSLGKECFAFCPFLTSIDIPSSVKSLGYDCFGGCSSLESITVDKNNKVYDSRDNCNAIIETSTNTMIQGCKTTIIPSSVTSLGSSCFWYCTSLTYVTIPSSVTSLGDFCFSNCTSLMSIDIPSSVTSLGYRCFSDCKSLTSIDIPSSVTSFGGSCFSKCSSLESITVDKNNKVYDSRDNCNAIIERSTNTMIQGCKTTVIPSSVTSLGGCCFENCTSLTSIDIPSSVTSLGGSCFYGCSSLTSIDIPSSVTSLGDRCFSDCSSLTSIDIPSSVMSLGKDCFYNCSSLTSIDIPSSVTSLGSSCFSGCSSLTSIDIPSSVTSLAGWCFSDCSSLKTVTCEIATPINGDFFFGTPIDQATLYVLEASLDAYRTTSPWSGFGTILPITSVGINYNTANKEVTIDAVYDLDGKRSNGTSRGLNIIRMSDGTTRKVMK